MQATQATQAALPLDEEHVETFRRDGVALIRGVLSAGEVARLHAGVERILARPTALGAELTPEGKQGRFFGDYFVWRQDPDFRWFAFESPLPALAQRLMGSRKVNLIWDHMLIKEPGTNVETPWHHDQPYAWANGMQNCSFWVSLDHVTRESGAVEYIRGSHKWGRWFQAVSFNPTRRYQNEEFEPMPDIEGARGDYDIVCYDTQPGDVVVQHLLTVHHAPGNATQRRRRAVAVRYAGDDATFAVRKKSPPVPVPLTLKAGEPLDCDLFPVVLR